MPPPASFAPWTPIGDGSPVVLMEALLGYGSSDSDGDGSDHDQPPSKRQKVAGAGQVSSACISAAPDCGPPATDEPEGPHGAAPAVLPSAAEVLGAGIDGIQAVGDHQGRSRGFAHVEGNYATHVYIVVGVPEKARQPLQSFLQNVKAKFPTLEPVLHNVPQLSSSGAHAAAEPSRACSSRSSRGVVQQQYHISLSRTVPIRLQQIESLVCALKQQLRKLDTFCISIDGPEVLVNDERTRTFVALSASASAGKGTQAHRGPRPAVSATTAPHTAAAASSSPLVRAIDGVSRAFQLHGLPRFYADPRPHISVAWLLGDCERQLATALAASGPLQQAAEQLPQCRWQVQVDKIYCKTGQKTFAVWESK